ncbi:hypothetical protein EVAR_40947_1 [Eumeta japonica]|uniref:Uncharacterized protein n=1 Tax=Eumeta variegata TaxID=151549 RepID=A0A4C1X3S9_EUMVA|nr:hypothetical protein EVAR_40947_1 [Eumeta japonica]
MTNGNKLKSLHLAAVLTADIILINSPESSSNAQSPFARLRHQRQDYSIFFICLSSTWRCAPAPLPWDSGAGADTRHVRQFRDLLPLFAFISPQQRTARARVGEERGSARRARARRLLNRLNRSVDRALALSTSTVSGMLRLQDVDLE